VKRWTHRLSGVPYISTTVRIMGTQQIATFEAMCERTGRKPFQLASYIVLSELWEAGPDPHFRRLGRQDRRWRRGRMVSGGGQ
jgi:hypothetical protein